MLKVTLWLENRTLAEVVTVRNGHLRLAEKQSFDTLKTKNVKDECDDLTIWWHTFTLPSNRLPRADLEPCLTHHTANCYLTERFLTKYPTCIYRPISCLSTTWTLFSGILDGQINEHLNTQPLLGQLRTESITARMSWNERPTSDRQDSDQWTRNRRTNLTVGWTDQTRKHTMPCRTSRYSRVWQCTRSTGRSLH